MLLWQVLQALELCPKNVSVCISETGPLQACQHTNGLPNALSFSRPVSQSKNKNRFNLGLRPGLQRALAGCQANKQEKWVLSLKSTSRLCEKLCLFSKLPLQ